MSARPPAVFLTQRMRWLVRLRWIVVPATAAVVGFTAALGIVDTTMPLAAIVICITVVNAGFSLASATLTDTSDMRVLERLVVLQLAFDIVALAFLLYWSGGPENPFAFFFVFPMIIAGILLSWRRAVMLALFGVALFGALTVAQMYEFIPHHAIHLGGHDAINIEQASLWHSPVYLAGYFSALLAASLGVIAFSSVLAHRLRVAEQIRYDVQRIAESRERLVRIGSLAAGVAHSIRNPLHGMLNCAALLRRRVGGNADLDEILDLMLEGGERIEGITRRLLAATRSDQAGRTRVSAERLLTDAVRFVEVLAREREVAIAVEADAGLSVTVDADRFVEALVCLLENSVQACGRNGRVDARAFIADQPAAASAFEISDTGVGMSDEVQRRVFEPFFTTKPIGEGTGLGLAICRRVVEQHGGTIAVESVPGEGTTIRIRLPDTPTRATDEETP